MTMSPGWYPDQGGEPLEREWDGSKWTGASRPVVAAADTAAAEAAPAKKKLELTPFGRILAFVGAFVLIVGAILAFGTIAGQNTSGGGGSTRDPDNQYEAISQCEARIERLLKAPSTAEFDSTAIRAVGWRVTGAVDAENGFGAMIRSYYECAVTINSDGTATTSVVSFE